MTIITGYDVHGNFLSQQELVNEIERLRAALKPFSDAAQRARSEKGDPAYGLRWDDFLRAQNCFSSDETFRRNHER